MPVAPAGSCNPYHSIPDLARASGIPNFWRFLPLPGTVSAASLQSVGVRSRWRSDYEHHTLATTVEIFHWFLAKTGPRAVGLIQTKYDADGMPVNCLKDVDLLSTSDS